MSVSADIMMIQIPPNQNIHCTAIFSLWVKTRSAEFRISAVKCCCLRPVSISSLSSRPTMSCSEQSALRSMITLRDISATVNGQGFDDSILTRIIKTGESTSTTNVVGNKLLSSSQAFQRRWCDSSAVIQSMKKVKCTRFDDWHCFLKNLAFERNIEWSVSHQRTFCLRKQSQRAFFRACSHPSFKSGIHSRLWWQLVSLTRESSLNLNFASLLRRRLNGAALQKGERLSKEKPRD